MTGDVMRYGLDPKESLIKVCARAMRDAKNEALGSRDGTPALARSGGYLMSAGPTGNLSLASAMPLETRANEAYQAARAVTSPT